MAKSKVSFLVANISAPSLGAALVLARNIPDAYDVEIVGPDMGQGVCSMYKGAFDYKVVSCPHLYRWPDFWWESRKLGRALEGDVIIAVKAYADTVPVALRERRRRGAKVVVYLDEWDGALFYQLNKAERLKRIVKDLHHPLEDAYYPLVERMIPKADHVLSTTSFVRNRFGGQVIYNGVDCDFFQPQPDDEVAALKKEWKVEGNRLIVFGGVVRPHKGVEQILDAMLLSHHDDLRLLVAGPLTPHLDRMMKDSRYAHLVRCAGAPTDSDSSVNKEVHDRMAHYLDMADLIVLPLIDSLLAQSQMPVKVFEAMAMAKPIIASRVSDLPVVLEGCGRIVDPGSPKTIAAEIDSILEDEAEAKKLGAAARARCLKLYSRAKTQSDLGELLERLLTRRVDHRS
ncbi:MAG: glycosyltransferase [Verrucomicrobia bacterium]|nr:glycosyltransferase [Verrucomicrobiota bacterium]